MARRRPPEAQPLDDEPPEWLWQFSMRRWLAEHDGSLDGLREAKAEWHQRCREWLDERGLVEWSHSSVTWHEYKRIQREEPHRIPRRPEER
ncbi:hypothetical protein OG426_16090 [Streptomyces canus]|uniref:hypothetical protein n=1 Tax=Streptomyces canus TaxID=58343 RepID=UPI00386C8DE7|nr:hypothetical protein OG426_16090 [Streptomyces canus]